MANADFLDLQFRFCQSSDGQSFASDRKISGHAHGSSGGWRLRRFLHGDVLSITETETCIVHLYSMDGMMDQDVAQCNTESGHGAGTASDCWTWVADYVDTQTCQDSINSIMDQVSRHRSVFTCFCASIRPTDRRR